MTWRQGRNPDKISEADFTRNVIKAAQYLGWKVAHFRPAMTTKGWRTAVSGDGKGFPDLVLVHPKRKRVIVAELKVGRGELTHEQAEWLFDFRFAGVEAFMWRPGDWPHIEAELKR